MRDQAADWFARLRGGAADPADLASFEAWLAADPRHRAAFDEIARGWDRVGSLAEAGPIRALRESALQVDQILPDPDERTRGRRWRVASAIAATALLLVAGLFWHERVDERHLATGKGDVRAVELADGSEITLDADTELVARVTPLSRTVEMVRGQALFRVAPERFRSFEVEAERVTARARGTVYAVALRPNEVVVSVQEGTVEIRDGVGPYVTELGASQLLSVVRTTRVRALRYRRPASARRHRGSEPLCRAAHSYRR
jgi:transmembrane sensor